MALTKCSQVITITFLLGLAMFFNDAQAMASRGLLESPEVFDVTKFGAKGDGKLKLNEDGDPVNDVAFVRAWRKACDSDGPAKVLIPSGRFVISQVLFGGPCKNNSNCIHLPSSLKIHGAAESVVNSIQGIKAINCNFKP